MMGWPTDPHGLRLEMRADKVFETFGGRLALRYPALGGRRGVPPMLKMRHSLSGLAVVLGLAGGGWYMIGGHKADAATPARLCRRRP